MSASKIKSTLLVLVDGIVAFTLLGLGILLTHTVSYSLLGRSGANSIAGILFWVQFIVGIGLGSLYLTYRRKD